MAEPSATNDALLAVDEAASYLRVNPYTVRRLAREGKLPAFKVGGCWRFRRTDLDALGTRAAAEPARRGPAGRKILVVDDDEAVLATLRGILESAGHEVRTATSGLDALNGMAAYAPDLVLTDLQMDEMDGAELLGRIRAGWGFMPVVIMTGYPDSELLQHALQHSPALLISKPFTRPQILVAVAQSLGLPMVARPGVASE